MRQDDLREALQALVTEIDAAVLPRKSQTGNWALDPMHPINIQAQNARAVLNHVPRGWDVAETSVDDDLRAMRIRVTVNPDAKRPLFRGETTLGDFLDNNVESIAGADKIKIVYDLTTRYEATLGGGDSPLVKILRCRE